MLTPEQMFAWIEGNKAQLRWNSNRVTVDVRGPGGGSLMATAPTLAQAIMKLSDEADKRRKLDEGGW